MHSGLWAICEKTWRNMERKGEDDRTEWLVFIIFIDINRKQSANLKNAVLAQWLIQKSYATWAMSKINRKTLLKLCAHKMLFIWPLIL